MTTSLERTLRGGCQVLYLQGGPSGQSAEAPPPSASAVCKQPALDEPKMLPFKKRRESKRGGGSSSDCVVQPAGCRRRLSTRATSEPVDERPPAILLLFGGRVGSEDGAAEALRTRPVQPNLTRQRVRTRLPSLPRPHRLRALHGGVWLHIPGRQI